MIKQIIACAALGSLLLCCPAEASAETAGMSRIEGIECYKNGTLTVSVSAEIPNLSGVHLSFIYDHKKLKFISQETAIGHGDIVDNSDTLEWSTMLPPEGQAVSYSDTIATLKFEVLDDIKDKEPCLSVGVSEAYDDDLKDVDFIRYGRLDLNSSGTFGNIGDLDSDKNYTANDALELLRLSTSTEKPNGKTFSIADVNRDQSVDAADALCVLRYSVGMDAGSADIGAPAEAKSSRKIYLDTIR